jgi:hypothetical protein
LAVKSVTCFCTCSSSGSFLLLLASRGSTSVF